MAEKFSERLELKLTPTQMRTLKVISAANGPAPQEAIRRLIDAARTYVDANGNLPAQISVVAKPPSAPKSPLLSLIQGDTPQETQQKVTDLVDGFKALGTILFGSEEEMKKMMIESKVKEAIRKARKEGASGA